MTRNLYPVLLALFLSSQVCGGVDAVQHRPKIAPQVMGQVTSAYPNPFTINTTIFYAAPEDAFVRVKLYNSAGKLMGELYDDVVEKGATYQFELDGSSMLPGVYYYTIESEKCVLHQRLELVR